MKLPQERKRLPRSFYDRPTADVARDLLGKALARQIGDAWLGGRIVETEAYLAEDDLASHSARGCTPGNASMFQRPGTVYVYPIHAKYCMNLVTEEKGRGCAVLIRAIEPLWGIDVMQQNRGQTDLRRLTRGPAMICQALQVNRSDDGVDSVVDPRLWIAEFDGLHGDTIASTPRIGISKAQSRLLRFFVNGNVYVSGRRRDHRRHDGASS